MKAVCQIKSDDGLDITTNPRPWTKTEQAKKENGIKETFQNIEQGRLLKKDNIQVAQKLQRFKKSREKSKIH